MGQNAGLIDDAVGCDLDVRQVARMWPVRVVEPMLLAGRVPMGACARKVRRVAAADRVDVDAMDAVRQAVCLDMEADAAAGLPGADGADLLAALVDQRRRRAALWLSSGLTCGEHCCCEQHRKKKLVTHRPRP